MDLKLPVCLILLVIVELLSVMSLKRWTSTKHPAYLVLGILGFLVIGVLFACTLHINGNLTLAHTLWQVLSIVVISIVGIMYFKDEISVRQSVGIVFAILAVVLIV